MNKKIYVLRVHEGNIAFFGWLVFLNFGDYEQFNIEFIDKYSDKSYNLIRLMTALGMKELERAKVPLKTANNYIIAVNRVIMIKRGIHND